MRRFVAKGISLAIHAILATIALLIVSRPALDIITTTKAMKAMTASVVYLPAAAPTQRGGGGGGNRAVAPPVKIEIPAPQPLVVVPEIVAAPADVPPSLAVPIMTSASAMLTATGGVDGAVAVPFGGGGSGHGIGTGNGDGVGPGDATGFGGTGIAGIGGITDPERIHEERPPYTPEARAEKIEGAVEVEAIVSPAGRVTEARVTKSLDRKFGLDEQARLAALRTLFRPCKQNGKPVACVVKFAVQFTIR